MTPAEQIDDILHDCLLAAGQGIGHQKPVDFEVIGWWRGRYRRFFLHAMTTLGTDWAADRQRVTAVGRYLGQRALHHAGDSPSVGLRAAALASQDVETGCQMNATREGIAGAPAIVPSAARAVAPSTVATSH
jgi:hypothetical protein